MDSRSSWSESATGSGKDAITARRPLPSNSLLWLRWSLHATEHLATKEISTANRCRIASVTAMPACAYSTKSGASPKIEMTTSTHTYHGYELVLHHESDDRYQVTIFDPKGNRIASTGTHLERQGALTEASRYVDQLLAQRRTT